MIGRTNNHGIEILKVKKKLLRDHKEIKNAGYG